MCPPQNDKSTNNSLQTPDESTRNCSSTGSTGPVGTEGDQLLGSAAYDWETALNDFCEGIADGTFDELFEDVADPIGFGRTTTTGTSNGSALPLIHATDRSTDAIDENRPANDIEYNTVHESMRLLFSPEGVSANVTNEAVRDLNGPEENKNVKETHQSPSGQAGPSTEPPKPVFLAPSDTVEQNTTSIPPRTAPPCGSSRAESVIQNTLNVSDRPLTDEEFAQWLARRAGQCSGLPSSGAPSAAAPVVNVANQSVQTYVPANARSQNDVSSQHTFEHGASSATSRKSIEPSRTAISSIDPSRNNQPLDSFAEDPFGTSRRLHSDSAPRYIDSVLQPMIVPSFPSQQEPFERHLGENLMGNQPSSNELPFTDATSNRKRKRTQADAPEASFNGEQPSLILPPPRKGVSRRQQTKKVAAPFSIPPDIIPQNPAPQGPFGQHPADNFFLLSNAAAPSGWMEPFAGGAMPSGISSSRKRKAETESGAQASLGFVMPPLKKVSRKRQTNMFPPQSIPQSGAFQFPPNPLHRHPAEDSASGVPGSFGRMDNLSGAEGPATASFGKKRKAEAIPEATSVDGLGLDMPPSKRISQRQQTNINPTLPCVPFSGTALQYPASQNVLGLDMTGNLGAVTSNVPDPHGAQQPLAGRTVPAAGHPRVKMNTEETFPQGDYPSSRWPDIVPPPRRVAHEQDIEHPRPGPVPGPSSSADPRLGIGSAGLERGSFRSLFPEPRPPSLPMPGPGYPVWHTQTVASMSNAPKSRPRKAHQKKRYQVIVVDGHGRRVSSQEIENMLGIRSIYPPDYEFPCPFPGCNIFFREEDFNKHFYQHFPRNIWGPRGPCVCPICPKTYKEIQSLRRHIRDHHLELLTVRCSCGAVIRRGMADCIERHLQTTRHRGDRQRLGLRRAAIDTLTGNIQTFIKEEDEDTVGNNVGLDRNDEDRQEGTSDGRRRQGN